MITESGIYWITRMDYIQTALFVLGGITTGLAVVSFVISAFCCMTNVIRGDSDAKRMMVVSKKTFLASTVCGLIFGSILLSACFVPSTKEMCAIKIIPRIVNNKEVQELPNKVVELANEWLEDLRPKKELREEE